MIRPNHGLDYAAYLKGDAWKCASSPTGAHHWMVNRRDTTCKYCLVNNVPKPSTPAGTLLMPANVAALPVTPMPPEMADRLPEIEIGAIAQLPPAREASIRRGGKPEGSQGNMDVLCRVGPALG